MRISAVPEPLQLTIHPSQFPDEEAAALAASLADGRVDPRLHYQTPLQSQRWLKVFERWSPFMNREDCRAIYRKSSRQVAAESTGDVAVIALGCGDGSKDLELLNGLRDGGARIHFVPLDVSASLSTRAALSARDLVASDRIHPIVADLARARDLGTWLDARLPVTAGRIFTFYGMIPNFEPQEVFPVLSGLLRPGDRLLFSANLVAGDDFNAAVERILPQYDNPETRTWLMTLLEEVGTADGAGELRFGVEPGSYSAELRRVVARFRFTKDSRLRILDQTFRYSKGADLRLFFSYRYSGEQIQKLFTRFEIRSLDSWITDHGEEGVFLCAADA